MLPLRGIDRIVVDGHARLGWIEDQDERSGHARPDPVEQIDDLRRQRLAIDGVARVQPEEGREIGLGHLGVAEIEVGPGPEVVGRGEQAQLLGAEIRGPRPVAEVDDRAEIPHRAGEVEVVDVGPCLVVGGSHRLEPRGQILLLLTRGAGRQDQPRGEERRRDQQRRQAAAHWNLTT